MKQILTNLLIAASINETASLAAIDRAGVSIAVREAVNFWNSSYVVDWNKQFEILK